MLVLLITGLAFSVGFGKRPAIGSPTIDFTAAFRTQSSMGPKSRERQECNTPPMPQRPVPLWAEILLPARWQVVSDQEHGGSVAKG